jgi:hypothetical protein
VENLNAVSSIIQAFGAVVFCGTVIFDVVMHRRNREAERRSNVINALDRLWVNTMVIHVGSTPEERSGFHSQRKVDFFNGKLAEMGEKWIFNPPVIK